MAFLADDLLEGRGTATRCHDIAAKYIAAPIEIAGAFENLPHAPARSILFLAVTAEEKGMVGSDYYAHFPTVPMKSIVANLNMDSPSLFYTFKDIIGGRDLHSLSG
jgi:Zn-dependent M28 family amino/carboxypeptidase